jgi:hypothetical protein
MREEGSETPRTMCGEALPSKRYLARRSRSSSNGRSNANIDGIL